MLWSSDIILDIKSYSDYHIDAVIIDSGNGFLWRLPGFMGIQRLILGKIFGNSFLFSIVNIIFPSFVVVISMKFFQ